MSPEISIDINFRTQNVAGNFHRHALRFTTQNVAGNFYRHLPSELKMSLEISIDIDFRTQNVVGNVYRHHPISELKMLKS